MRSSHFGLQNTLQSFGDISRFLREGVVDEESGQLRESLGHLSAQIEKTVRARREAVDPPTLVKHAQQLGQAVRDHLRFLTGLGSGWHALYELGVYQQALRELLKAVQAWQQALEKHSSGESDLFRRCEMLAWRTLGEALLLIDMYEHRGDAPNTDQEGGGVPQRLSLLDRLSAWLRRRICKI